MLDELPGLDGVNPEGLADAELRVGDEKEKGLNKSWGTECTGGFPSMKSAFGSTNTEKEGSRSIGLNPKPKRGSSVVSWVLLRSMYSGSDRSNTKSGAALSALSVSAELIVVDGDREG